MITQQDIDAAHAAAIAVPGRIDHKMVGSAYTYDREKANDVDMLVLVSDLDAAVEHCNGGGYVEHDEHIDYDDERSHPVKLGKTNLLLTSDHDWFAGFVRAAEVCRYLQLEERAQRVIVHKIVRDGASSDNYREPKVEPDFA